MTASLDPIEQVAIEMPNRSRPVACLLKGSEIGIGNQEIWSLEIGRILHLRAEIINLRLDREPNSTT
jgi:hypothetical protein